MTTTTLMKQTNAQKSYLTELGQEADAMASADWRFVAKLVAGRKFDSEAFRADLEATLRGKWGKTHTASSVASLVNKALRVYAAAVKKPGKFTGLNFSEAYKQTFTVTSKKKTKTRKVRGAKPKHDARKLVTRLNAALNGIKHKEARKIVQKAIDALSDLAPVTK